MGNEFFARKGLALGTASQSLTDDQVLVLGTDGVVKYRTDIIGGSASSGTSGSSGTRGTSGTSGTRGTSGSSGTSGTQGRSSGVLYNFITSTTNSDPLSTNFKFRGSGTLSSVNNILISVIDYDNINQSLWLSTMNDGYLILRSNSNTGDNFAVMTITNSVLVTSSPQNYYSLTVDINYTTGNWNLSSTDLVSINFSKAGAGTSGTRGTSGSSGTSGTRGTSGTSGLLTLTGTTNNGLITLDGTSPNGTVESNLTFDGTTLTVTGDIVATGNFTVSGTTSTINTTNLLVEDPLILLSSTQSGTPVLDSGIMINRGTGATQAFIWDESADEFAVISTNNPSTTYGNLTILGYSNLRAGGLTVSQIKISDGTQGNGKYLISDSNGIASWTASNALYEVHTGLNSTRRIGVGNTASADYSATLAGSGNSSNGQYSVIVGGQNNYLSGSHSFIGGGQNNSNYSVDYLAIVGGQNNKAQAEYSFIGTGFNNTILLESLNSSIIAGQYNTASAANVHIIGSNIIGTYSDTAYVNKLNIGSFSSQSTANILGVDSNGNVTVGSLSSGTSGTSGSTPFMSITYQSTGFNLSVGTVSLPVTQTLYIGWQKGTRLRLWNSSTSYMEGVVSTTMSYPQPSGQNIDVLIDRVVGSGTPTSWRIGIAGDVGSSGASASQTLAQTLALGNSTGQNWIEVDISGTGGNGIRHNNPLDKDKMIKFSSDGILSEVYGNVTDKLSSISIVESGITLSSKSDTGAFPTNESSIDLSQNGNIVINNTNALDINSEFVSVTGQTGTFQGVEYASDYSANFTNRSLVDKEYVDSRSATSSGANNQIQLSDGAGKFKPYGFFSTASNNTVITNTASTTLSGVENTIIGINAGWKTTGSSNTFIGSDSGYNNLNDFNTFLGWCTGYKNTTGSSNTFIGPATGCSNTTGSGNIFIHGGNFNSTGNDNIYIGNGSGSLGTASIENVFIGSNAGTYNLTSYNTFIGTCAGHLNGYGLNNTYIGYNSGSLAGTFSYWSEFSLQNIIIQTCNNTFLGFNSGYFGSALQNNTFIGYKSGYSSTTTTYYNGSDNFPVSANNNTFIGSESGYSNLHGVNNTFIGYKSGWSNTSYNIFDFFGNTIDSGDNNVFIGTNTGYSNKNGNFNTYIGVNAGYSGTQSGNSTFIGYCSGNLNTANYNTFVGAVSGPVNTTGTYNSFFGDGSGLNNTTGSCNTFIGMVSGCCTTTGGHNTFIGNRSGSSNINGAGNVALGSDAMLNGNYSCVISIGACSSPSANGQFLIGSTTYPVLTGTTASAGTNGDVPSQVSRYMCIILNGTQYKIPLYN